MAIPEAVTNLRAARCARCGLLVRTAEGVAEEYLGGPVVHLGRCPSAAVRDGEEIPDDATRIVLHTDEWNQPARVTDDPAAARAWLAGRPRGRRPDLLRVECGPRPLHVVGLWSLWDDGRLVHNARWLASDGVPTSLSRAATLAVSRCLGAQNQEVGLDPRIWGPLCDTIHESSEGVDAHSGSGIDEQGGRWHLDHSLTRHTFTLGDGRQRLLWDLFRSTRYAGSDISGSDHRYRIFLDEAVALREFAAGKREAERQY